MMSPSRLQRMDAETSGARFVDPEALMRVRPLELRAKVVVEGFLRGLHRSPFHGFSVEFTEYRQYSPGDDPRYLDWKLYARSDRHYIKRFEDETNLRCHVLLDLSHSMSFGSGTYTKSEYAKTLAATLAFFLSAQRDAVGLMTFDDEIVEHVPARYRPGHMHRLLLTLERTRSGRATDLSAPIDQIARVVAKRGMVVLISDLLAPLDSLENELGTLRSRGHEVVVFRVLDPAERDFTFRSAAVFEDMESQRKLYVDPEAARRDYLLRFEDHASQIRRICDDLGIDYTSFTLDRPLELALLDFVSSRFRRGRKTSRLLSSRSRPAGRAATEGSRVP